MTVRASGDEVLLSGDCSAEDAEALLGILIDNPNATIDLTECGSIHTAVAQVLLAARPVIRGVPADPIFADWIVPQVLDAAPETTSRRGGGAHPEQG